MFSQVAASFPSVDRKYLESNPIRGFTSFRLFPIVSIMKLKDDPIRVGSTIRCLRESYGWARRPFAGELGISLPHLSNIEDGRRSCTPQVARKVADVLGIPLAAITTALPAEAITEEPIGLGA